MNKYIETIKKLRTEKSLSQEEVATAIDVSRPTYAAIEAGKQSLDVEEAKKLASLFGIGIDELLLGASPDLPKYKHMILSFLRLNLANDGKVPKTKLAKLLYLADFAWFYDNLTSMSGMQYRKLEHGPVPDYFFRAIDELEEAGKIIVERKNLVGRDMLLISESKSNVNEKTQTVSAEEVRLIKKIALKWKDKPTKEIVNFTHNQLPYFLCRKDELIPYELITQEDPDKVY